jgi:ketosteroid isomerase-like protein
MADHPNIQRLRTGYDAFAKGDFPALDALFAEDIHWESPGRNQLSGTYEGRAAVYDFFRRLMEVTEGTFRVEVHKIFADDSDAVVVATSSGRRGQVSAETLDAHVWRLRGGRTTHFRIASSDQYAVDELFG